MKMFANALDSETLHRSMGSPNHKLIGSKVILAKEHNGGKKVIWFGGSHSIAEEDGHGEKERR